MWKWSQGTAKDKPLADFNTVTAIFCSVQSCGLPRDFVDEADLRYSWILYDVHPSHINSYPLITDYLPA
jgi:hypothetical protein